MRFYLSFILVLASGISASASNEPACMHGRGHISKKLTGGFEIQVSPFPDKSNPDLDECEAEIYNPSGDVFFSEHDWSFVIELAGPDVNGDGIPDVVLEAYSGGAHCCWTYYIISLGSKPGLIKKFENTRDAAFFWNKENRRIQIATRDGNFDYFDEVCHACSPFPLVYLRLDGANLVDISPEHASDYDQIIRDSQNALTTEVRQRLKALTVKPSEAGPVGSARYKALTIVFAYLYSGREEQARQALRELWPPFDQERIWNLILETRHNGVLCYTRRGAVCGEEAAAQ